MCSWSSQRSPHRAQSAVRELWLTRALLRARFCARSPMSQVALGASVEDESCQLQTRAEECIMALKKKDVIELKEQYQNSMVRTVLQLLCVIKGKTPTWESCRELLNPITFVLEFTRINVSRLKLENICRAYNHLIANKELFNTSLLHNMHPAAIRVLEWINIAVILYKHRAGRVTEASMLPEISKRKNQSFDVAQRKPCKQKGFVKLELHSHALENGGARRYVTKNANCAEDGDGVRGTGIVSEARRPNVFKSRYRMKHVNDLLKDTTKLENFLDRLAEPKAS
eukprot:TRINITY_DN1957_c0_g1_i1.p1 TRINITY_DN1957_c0_g1~~TRINITY_DN1957_c0_g1_i1.p1  ORF type:complete len:284 (-),score=33.34 TRINITY_DN1957_c0_g1_i1:125-976(-)